jgi:hypothetical protein
MKKTFLYNILQYKHSLILNESINIGILFVFPQENVIKYVSGDLERVKLIYPNIEISVVEKIIKGIVKKVEARHLNEKNLFSSLPDSVQLEEHQKLLRNDDSSLQFTETKKTIYPFEDIGVIISEYSDLLLPAISDNDIEARKDEHYILKTYTNYLIQKVPRIDNLIAKDRIIESNGIKLKFDYGWQNGTFNLVRPVSFDLKKPSLIQTKSVTYFGYLYKLKTYALKNKARYDLLVGKPQNENFIEEYERAIKTIESAKAPIRIIAEQNLQEYSEETVHSLKKKLQELDEDENPF